MVACPPVGEWTNPWHVPKVPTLPSVGLPPIRAEESGRYLGHGPGLGAPSFQLLLGRPGGPDFGSTPGNEFRRCEPRGVDCPTVSARCGPAFPATDFPPRWHPPTADGASLGCSLRPGHFTPRMKAGSRPVSRTVDMRTQGDPRWATSPPAGSQCTIGGPDRRGRDAPATGNSTGGQRTPGAHSPPNVGAPLFAPGVRSLNRTREAAFKPRGAAVTITAAPIAVAALNGSGGVSPGVLSIQGALLHLPPHGLPFCHCEYTHSRWAARAAWRALAWLAT